jgi:hypothetical protein
VFALGVDAGEEIAFFEAAGAGALDDAGAWVLGGAVEVCTLDELDEVGLDVEEHPVRNDVVIIMSPATIGIEFFISPTNRQRWEHYTTMTHQAPEPRNVTPGLVDTDGLWAARHVPRLFPRSTESLTCARAGRDLRPEGVALNSGAHWSRGMSRRPIGASPPELVGRPTADAHRAGQPTVDGACPACERVKAWRV